MLPSKTIGQFKGDYEFLSNFYKTPFGYQGKTWNTAENAFQEAKSIVPVDRNVAAFLLQKDLEDVPKDWSMCTCDPGEAKRIGRKVPLRNDWMQVREQVMLEILRAKFSVPKLKQKLLATGDATLIEGNTWNDTFWGKCNGTGRNKLGLLLMQVREEKLNEIRNPR